MNVIERRSGLRFRFDADSEFSVEGENAPVKARVSEISLKGCYIQTKTPVEQGKAVAVKIYHDGNFFEGVAKVAYAHDGQGMGVVFENAKPHFAGVLKSWLLAAMARKEAGLK